MEIGDDAENVINVNIYDTHGANANFKVKRSTTAADISRIILSKRDMRGSNESRFFSVVLVVTAYNASKKSDIHCLRTLKANEGILEIKASIAAKMMERYNVKDKAKLDKSCRWYFKDMRTNPIELGGAADVTGEYSSDDDDEEISQSDLSYLAKSERKGYLLKRSNTDFNLWRRWYCVLMDKLWCVDISRENPRAKNVTLSGMIRYREGYKTLDQLQIIIINSPDGKSHFFRAFNLIDQKKWIQDLNLKTLTAAEHNCFSMAEMIINDEEGAKTQRLVKTMGDLLDLPKTMEAIAQHRAIELRPPDDRSKTLELESSSPSSSSDVMLLKGAIANTGAEAEEITLNKSSLVAEEGDRFRNDGAMMEAKKEKEKEDGAAIVEDEVRAQISNGQEVCEHAEVENKEQSDHADGHNNSTSNSNNNGSTSNNNIDNDDNTTTAATVDDNNRNDGSNEDETGEAVVDRDSIKDINAANATLDLSEGSMSNSAKSNANSTLVKSISRSMEDSSTNKNEKDAGSDDEDTANSGDKKETPSTRTQRRLRLIDSMAAAAAAADTNAADITATATTGCNRGKRDWVHIAHPRPCSDLDIQDVNVLRRTASHHNLVHELHRDSRIVADIMAFFTDVQHFKELLRHDVCTSVHQQQKAARGVYVTHILPQILYTDIELTSDFVSQIKTLSVGMENILNPYSDYGSNMYLGGKNNQTSSSGHPAGVSINNRYIDNNNNSNNSNNNNNNNNSPSKIRNDRRNEYASRVRTLALGSNNASSSSSTSSSSSSSSVAATANKHIRFARSYGAAASTASGAITGGAHHSMLNTPLNWQVPKQALLVVHNRLLETQTHLTHSQLQMKSLLPHDITQNSYLLDKYGGNRKLSPSRSYLQKQQQQQHQQQQLQMQQIQQQQQSSWSWFSSAFTNNQTAASAASSIAQNTTANGAGGGRSISNDEEIEGERSPPVDLFEEVMRLLIMRLT